MQELSKIHAGLDVHKDSIAIAAAEPGRAAAKLIGTISNDVPKLLKMLAKLGGPDTGNRCWRSPRRFAPFL